MPTAETPVLLPKTTCPNCWHQFEPQDALWIAAHPALRGDPRLGADAETRFLPSRFAPSGAALDAMGTECTLLACPRCHLGVPRVCLEAQPWFVSVFGAPSSGKSYFLAAMTWALRRRLTEQFRVRFTDADAATNQPLIRYEEPLFYNPNPDSYLPLGQLIAKTTEAGELYNLVRFGGEEVRYPQPFLFTLRPHDGHPLEGDAGAPRVMCLYDNAGESFQSGSDKANNPVTRHLAESALLLFLFDPLQHPPFHRRVETTGLRVASDIRTSTGVTRQDLILTEAATRVRRFAHLRDADRLDRPLVVVVTKRDVWAPLVPELTSGEPPIAATKSRNAALNLDRIAEQSAAIRRLLVAVVPELVTAAESLSSCVSYMGASALGVTPVEQTTNGTKQWCVRPSDLKPDSVELPILYGLNRSFAQLIPGGRRAASAATATATAKGARP